MSFGREASPWGVRVHAAADQAGRRLRAASEHVADRAWFAKYDLVRGCRSIWLLGRARARLRIDALLWWIGAVRQGMATGPARAALGASLTLLAGALVAAAFVVLSDGGGSAGDASHGEGAVAGSAHEPATGDVAGAARPDDALRAAAVRAPASPGSPLGERVDERPAPPGSPPASPRSERSAPAPPDLLDRRPATVPPGAPDRDPAAGPVSPPPAPVPPIRDKPDRPAPPPAAQERPDRPGTPPPAQDKPDRPGSSPPAQEKPEQPAAPPPAQAEGEHPQGGPPGQQKKEDSAGLQKTEDPPAHGNGRDGRPDGP